MFNCTCIQCNANFSAQRSTAKFCSAKCRVTYARTSIEKRDAKAEEIAEAQRIQAENRVAEEVKPEIEDPDFTPNWKRSGFKNAEEGRLYAIGKIIQNKVNLKKLGLSNELIIIYKGRTLII